MDAVCEVVSGTDHVRTQADADVDPAPEMGDIGKDMTDEDQEAAADIRCAIFGWTCYFGHTI